MIPCYRSRRRAALAALVALTVSLLPLSGGLASRANAARSQAPVSNQRGGALVVAFHDDPTTLDPAICYDLNECWSAMKILFNRLIDYHRSQYFVPEDADLPSVSNDGRVYTFRLHHGLRFSNGRAITAADYKYSFERVIDPRTQSPAQSFWLDIQGSNDFVNGKAKHVSGIQVVNPYELRITLSTPDATFLNVVAMPFGSVVPQNVAQRYGVNFWRHLVGSGPYVLKAYVPGQRIVFTRNPYFADHSQQNLDSIVYKIGASAENALLQLERNQVDLLGDGIPPADFESTIKQYSRYIFKTPLNHTAYLAMNYQMKPFNNLLVRQAVNMALDKPFILRFINGRGTVAHSILPPLMPGYSARVHDYPYNPTQARALLAKAGYPNGFSTTLYGQNVDPWPRLAAVIVDELSAVGIKVTPRLLSNSAFNDVTTTPGKAPLSLNEWYEDFPDPSDFLRPILSCTSAVKGGQNLAFYCDKKVDAADNAALAMTNRAQRLARYGAIDQMVMNDAPWAPLYHLTYYDVHTPSLHNYYFDPVWSFVFTDYWKS